MPILKVRYISTVEIFPVSCIQLKIAGGVMGVSNLYPNGLSRLKFNNPPPVTWHIPCTVQVAVTCRLSW